MKALHILVASSLIFAVAGPSAARAEQGVIENHEVIETTQATVSEPVVIERQTTIIEKKEGPDVDIDVGSGGIVSSTIDVTGEVLALPFKLVGGLIGLVF
jgi:hypothetical protein